MTLMEHLYELRHRLFMAVLAILVGAIAGFVWFSVGIPSLRIPSLGDVLIGPYCAIPAHLRIDALAGDSGACFLLATTPFSALQLRLTAAILAGVVITSPVWLYQLWAYVGPALYSKEKRFAITFTAVGALLFTGGMVLAYMIIPEALKVLIAFGGEFVKSGLDPERYYKFLLGMMLIFGVSLELPLLLVMLNFAGVIKGVKLAQARRYAFFGLVLFSGFAVPGNDPISMGVLAVTLCLLYEVAVQVTKSHDKRKLKRAAAVAAELPDDVASALEPGGETDGPDSGTTAGRGIEAPAPVEAPEPVAGATPLSATEDPTTTDTPTGWDDVT